MPYKNKTDEINHSRSYYRKNAEKIKERERKKYFSNKETIRKRRRELSTIELKARNAERERLRYVAYRGIIIKAYGGKCACCGESESMFLEIDHINNDGNNHRKKIGASAKALTYWLINNNFPDGFQILCSNCNQGKKRNNGVCPHQQKKGR